MGNAVGASVEELRALAAQFASSADRLRNTSGSVRQGVQISAWVGPIAANFRAMWDSEHSGRLKSAATELDEAATLLRRNADDQERTSAAGTGGGSGRDAHALWKRAHGAGAGGSMIVLGASGETTVEITEMSDGTYRVVVHGQLDRKAGIGVKDLFKAAGMNVPVDLGADVSAGTEYEVEFSLPNRAAAEDLERLLRDSASSPGGRFNAAENQAAALLAALATGAGAGATLEGVTLGGGVSGGTAGEFGTGVDAGAGGSISRTSHPDGSYEVTHSYDMNLNMTGLDTGSDIESHHLVRSYDASGRLETVTVVSEGVVSTDTRGNVERGIDFARGIIPVLGHEHSETSVSAEVRTTTYDVSQLSNEQLQLASDGEVAKFVQSASDHRLEVVTERYVGVAESDAQHYGPVESSDDSSEMRLVSRDVYTGPGLMKVEGEHFRAPLPSHERGGGGGGGR